MVLDTLMNAGSQWLPEKNEASVIQSFQRNCGIFYKIAGKIYNFFTKLYEVYQWPLMHFKDKALSDQILTLFIYCNLLNFIVVYFM